VPNAAQVPSFHRPRALASLLALLLACLTVGLAPALAGAQSIVPDAQTKQEQKAAEEAEGAAATTGTVNDTSGDSGLEYGLLGIGVLLLAGAAFWILRDSSDAIGDRQRAAPNRPLDTDAVGRGAPRAMFTGEGEPGGKTGKRNKRKVGKRQRQARKANRPR
jgi:hypothetical protein